VPFTEGLKRTIDWYVQARTPPEVAAALPGKLTER
jgi:hypothetical protein